MTGYEPQYETTDMKDIFVDLIASGLVEFVTFVGIIILLVLMGWLFTKIRKLTKVLEGGG